MNMKTTRFANSTIKKESKFSTMDISTQRANVIMASKDEVLSPIGMIFHNANISALMLMAADMRKGGNQEELSLQCALNEAALFSMTGYFQSDEERLEYLKHTIPAIRGFYADGYRIIINPNWNNK